MRREIRRLVADGLYREALLLFPQLHSSTASADKYTFPVLLKACGKLNVLLSGEMLHTCIIKTGFGLDIYTSTALTGMYMKTHQMSNAAKVFDETPHRNVALVNAMISGLSQNGHFKEAMVVLREVVGFTEFKPNSITVASVLSGRGLIEHGRQLHCWAVKLGVERDAYVRTGILTMYMACGRLVSATKVFMVMDDNDRNVVIYNAFVSGLLHNGTSHGTVFRMFKELLQVSSERPNIVTYMSVLSACSEACDLYFGRQIHGLVVKTGFELETKVGTALIDMYSKCGCFRLAYHAFGELNECRNLISWNTMMSGFMLNGEHDAAGKLFIRMQSEGFLPDSVTWNTMISGFSHLGKGIEAFQFFRKMQSCGVRPILKSLTSILSACSVLLSLNLGKEIHAYAIRNDYNHDEYTATTLIDMYMKCGQFPAACKIFNQFKVKPSDPAFWNAMISGCERNGEADYAFIVFDMMQKEHVFPNSTTFLAVLSVCSHTGNADKGVRVFRLMRGHYGLVPEPDHVSCLVALLGRLGQLDKARELIKEIPEPSASTFLSLLGASGSHVHCELGEDMAKQLANLEPENSLPFSMLSNIYAKMGRWEDVEKVRHMLDIKQVTKLHAISVEVA